ncbi:MAG: hypothetical protein WDM81_01460 [Rhizomicrobium sp.]
MKNETRRNLAVLRALFFTPRWLKAGGGERDGMRASNLKRRHVAVQDRPDWLPHPVLMHAIAALWIAVAALRLLTGPHL